MQLSQKFVVVEIVENSISQKHKRLLLTMNLYDISGRVVVPNIVLCKQNLHVGFNFSLA